jgi:hypothetical protein
MRGRRLVWANAGVTVDASRANSTNNPILKRDAELTNFDLISKPPSLPAAKSHNLLASRNEFGNGRAKLIQ